MSFFMPILNIILISIYYDELVLQIFVVLGLKINIIYLLMRIHGVFVVLFLEFSRQFYSKF